MQTTGDGWGFAVFGDMARKHRLRLGLTQEELAQKAQISVRSLGNIEGSRVSAPRQASVRLLADALGLTGTHRERFFEAAAQTGGNVPVFSTLAQLPPDVSRFAGRDDYLRRLSDLRAIGDTGQAPMIAAITGTAGVGKTALALHWAHRVTARFPDGQLYVNLRGYDLDRPLAASAALAGFLAALGVPGPEIPLDVDEQARTYRSLLANRRVLIVLDNAAGPEQVRPLLAGTSTCVTLVTSRDSLAGLVARDGAERLELDLLPLEDAIRLLRSLIGGRVDDEPEAAVALAQRCARLPLALRVAAELVSAYPQEQLADLVAEVELARFTAGGDMRSDVRAVFSWSLRHLPELAARLFRLLGLSPAEDFDAHAAAALAGQSYEDTVVLLRQLHRAYLVQPLGHRRFGLHDLLRAFAMELAAVDPQEEREGRVTALLDYYVSTAEAASEGLKGRAAGNPQVSQPDTAKAWLNRERANLVAIGAYAAAHGSYSHAVRLSPSLFVYLDRGGHTLEALAIHEYARAAAVAAHDQQGEGDAHLHLGIVYWIQGRHSIAAEHCRHAIGLYQQTGDADGEIKARNNLGAVYWRLGRYADAAAEHATAVAVSRAAGDRSGEGRSVGLLGSAVMRLGRYQEAVDHQLTAIDIARQVDAPWRLACAQGTLADAYTRLGRYADAWEQAEAALEGFRALGDRGGEANVFLSFSDAAGRSGQHQMAVDYLLQALDIFRDGGDRSGETETLIHLGENLTKLGRAEEARELLVSALDMARQTGERFEQARAHAALAEVEPEKDHRRIAYELFSELGVPEAAEVKPA